MPSTTQNWLRNELQYKKYKCNSVNNTQKNKGLMTSNSKQFEYSGLFHFFAKNKSE